MRAGPREEPGDLVPRHDNGQTTRSVQLVITGRLARRGRDGGALLEHAWMPRPEEGAELVPVVAAREHATQGKDHEEQEGRPQGKPQGRP